LNRTSFLSLLAFLSLIGIQNPSLSFPSRNGFPSGIQELQKFQKQFPSTGNKQLKAPSAPSNQKSLEDLNENDLMKAAQNAMEKKRYEELKRIANQGIKLQPEDKKIYATFYRLRGMATMNLQPNQEGVSSAISDWKTSSEIAPDSYELAETYEITLELQAGLDKEKAMNMASQAMKENKKDSKVHKVVGSFYQENKENKKALDAFNKAIKLSPKESDLYKLRGIIKYDELNDKKGGCKDMKTSSNMGNEDAKGIYMKVCAPPREKARYECDNLENMVLMGMNTAAIIQGQMVLSGGDPEVMKKLNIMEGMCPDVFVERTPRQW
tara:strand:+ start:181 stop:1152 length:972 start_codon:yes stop_codon:yes gene_type:complete